MGSTYHRRLVVITYVYFNPKIETFTIPDKITGELVTRNRFDSSGFYVLEKKGDTYEVKLKTREEVLKELDPSKPSSRIA